MLPTRSSGVLDGDQGNFLPDDMALTLNQDKPQLCIPSLPLKFQT